MDGSDVPTVTKQLYSQGGGWHSSSWSPKDSGCQQSHHLDHTTVLLLPGNMLWPGGDISHPSWLSPSNPWSPFVSCTLCCSRCTLPPPGESPSTPQVVVNSLGPGRGQLSMRRFVHTVHLGTRCESPDPRTKHWAGRGRMQGCPTRGEDGVPWPQPHRAGTTRSQPTQRVLWTWHHPQKDPAVLAPWPPPARGPHRGPRRLPAGLQSNVPCCWSSAVIHGTAIVVSQLPDQRQVPRPHPQRFLQTGCGSVRSDTRQ